MRSVAIVVFMLMFSGVAAAGDATWMWMPDASVFAGLNIQNRKFTDFTAFESQNWFMLDGERRDSRGSLKLNGMLSLEPFTMKKIGSAQVFQTGEEYHGAPLIDYQHPHDLIMGLGAAYTLGHERVGYTLETDVVGAAALGPTPFMHRESARNNPQAPLTHHQLDSTHVTPGVVRAAVSSGTVTIDASVFTGREPDDNRLDIDPIHLDSWSARAAWRPRWWHFQASGARIHNPESFEPYDITRLTASAEFNGHLRTRALSATVAWGENREFHGVLDGYLAEWDYAAAAHGSLYGRAEFTAKDLLDLGSPSPPGFPDFHRISHVGALTIGYVHDVSRGRFRRVGIGADVTLYHVSEDLQESYGSPQSFHVFLRWRPDVHTMDMPMN